MIVLLIINMIMVVNCLNEIMTQDINEDIKSIMGKYLNKIPDMEPRYVLNDKLSSVINHYFKGKISTLPLYRISLKIDRNPVKIPWSLNSVDEAKDDVVLQRARSLEEEPNTAKQGRHYEVVKASGTHSSKNPDATEKASEKATSTTTEPPLIEIQ